MPIRSKVTVFAPRGVIRTYDQKEHESLDEFRARALHSMGFDEGDEYVWFECRGHKYHGLTPEPTLGTKHIFKAVGQCKRVPSLFVRRGTRIYDYKEAPDGP